MWCHCRPQLVHGRGLDGLPGDDVPGADGFQRVHQRDLDAVSRARSGGPSAGRRAAAQVRQASSVVDTILYSDGLEEPVAEGVVTYVPLFPATDRACVTPVACGRYCWSFRMCAWGRHPRPRFRALGSTS